MRDRYLRLAVTVGLATAALLAGAAPAGAGTYTVRQCDWATGNGHHDFVWHEAGVPTVDRHAGSGCGEFGLALRNGGGGSERTYPSGAYGGYFAYAPPGTVFTAFSGHFGVLAGSCCVTGMYSYGEATELPNGQGQRAYLFQGELGNQTWYAPTGVQGPVGRGWSSATTGFVAARVGFQLRCGPGWTCHQGRYADLRMRGRTFQMTLRDDHRPVIDGVGGSLLAGGWQRGTRTVAMHARDAGGGLALLGADVEGGPAPRAAVPCVTVGGVYARLAPCPLARGAEWAIDTTRLADGVRRIELSATDAGGARAAVARTFAVDNHAPAAPIDPTVAGGSGWRSANGFELRWTNPGGQHAPIVRARWRACPAGAPPDAPTCVSGARDGDGVAASDSIRLPSPGEWDVRAWLEDAAGNSDPATATRPARLRFDPEPPRIEFLPTDPARPATVTVAVSDRSGVTGGHVELRRHDGSAGWRALPTTAAGGRLTAQLDDRLAGAYELRARATDAAGNAGVGYGGVRTLPVRAATRLTGHLLVRARRAKPGCKPVRAARCRKVVTVQRQAARVARGGQVVLRATLRTAAGRPLAGAPLDAVLISAGRETALPRLTTDSAGAVATVLGARRSATVRLRYAGDGRHLASGVAELEIRVPAAATIASAGPAVRAARQALRRASRGRADRRRADRRRQRARQPSGQVVAVAGRVVRFHGRVTGAAVPRGGKLVEVQAHFRGRWRTISAVRSDRRGRWAFRYRFGTTGATARYRMRARVPAEAGYPFAAGTSKSLRVTVPGARR